MRARKSPGKNTASKANGKANGAANGHHSPFRVGRSRTGLGVFATEPIKKGSFIVEYTGPLLTNKERRALAAYLMSLK